MALPNPWFIPTEWFKFSDRTYKFTGKQKVAGFIGIPCSNCTDYLLPFKQKQPRRNGWDVGDAMNHYNSAHNDIFTMQVFATMDQLANAGCWPLVIDVVE